MTHTIETIKFSEGNYLITIKGGEYDGKEFQCKKDGRVYEISFWMSHDEEQSELIQTRQMSIAYCKKFVKRFSGGMSFEQYAQS